MWLYGFGIKENLLERNILSYDQELPIQNAKYFLSLELKEWIPAGMPRVI